VLNDSGEPAQALAAFSKAMAIREKLAAANPDDPTAARDLAIAYGQLADVLRPREIDRALDFYRKSLAVLEALAAAAPEAAAAQRSKTTQTPQKNLGPPTDAGATNFVRSTQAHIRSHGCRAAQRLRPPPCRRRLTLRAPWRAYMKKLLLTVTTSGTRSKAEPATIPMAFLAVRSVDALRLHAAPRL
jgi:hypothetical protein